MVLQRNIFIEQVRKHATIRGLTPEEVEHYRRPFLELGEGRRPTLSFPRNLPLDGETPDTVLTIAESADWMARSAALPKLFIHGEPGTLMRGRVLEKVRPWPNRGHSQRREAASGGQP
jgi:haloalkane dehalogenase